MERKKRMVTIPDLLAALHRAGGTVRLDGGDLLVRFAARPPADLIEALRQHKPQVVTFLLGETVCYGQGPDEGALPGDGSVPAEGSAPADGGGLPPPLGDQVAALLDKLRAHGCQVEALPDGVTFRADFLSCGKTASLDIVEGPHSVPHVWARCQCLDPLAGLDAAELLPLATYRQIKAAAQGLKTASPDTDLPEFRRENLASGQQTFDWKPTHTGG
jgi:hypothetical protein